MIVLTITTVFKMYLENIKLWNFRKYGSDSREIDLKTPDLDLTFNKSLNVIVGANDSGKTAILDAIRLVLQTHSDRRIYPQNEDFYQLADRFRIELKIVDLTDDEAKYFTEYLGCRNKDGEPDFFLRLLYQVSRRQINNSDDWKILPADVRAGVGEGISLLQASAREYLYVTYLKPLRDAENELIAKRYSRLSQILLAHPDFKADKDHEIIDAAKEFNKKVASQFDNHGDKKGIKDSIDKYIEAFFAKELYGKSNFKVASNSLQSILEKISIDIEGTYNLGLGSLNRLFMATELLHLKQENDNIKLALIEELEAHIHPQAQMKVIKKLKEICEDKEKTIQMILTTHSPNLASQVSLEHLIICNESLAYPMGAEFTKLNSTNYRYLERFLDVTKANLFFAKGLILVEGWSEEIIIPMLAKMLGYDLTDYGVSVVNVANTAFLHYANIFQRSDKCSSNREDMRVRLSVVTDLDWKPEKYANYLGIKKNDKKKKKCILESDNKEIISIKKNNKKLSLKIQETDYIKIFISDAWTLEYCFMSHDLLKWCFFEAVLLAQYKQNISKYKESSKALQKIKQQYEDFKNKKEFVNWVGLQQCFQYEHALNTQLQILGELKYGVAPKESISKAVIAQEFVSILQDPINIVNSNLITSDSSIQYLIDAITHACGIELGAI